MSHATVNRREFLKTGAAAGATLVVGLYLPAFDPRGAAPPASPEPFKPNAWIEIGPDGAVTIWTGRSRWRSEEHTSELQSRGHLVCRLLLEKKKKKKKKQKEKQEKNIPCRKIGPLR